MRRGEVLGLRWRDLNLPSGWLTVQQAIVVVNNEAIVSQPKTKSSRRLIALDQATVDALVEHRLKMISERALLDLPAPTDEDLVFANIEGECINPNHFSGAFGRRVEAAGLPLISLHGLRHTWATLALQANIHPKTVSERLGHSSISITLNTYSHAIPALQADAADKVASLIFES